jgi:hypothetical protein
VAKKLLREVSGRLDDRIFRQIFLDGLVLSFSYLLGNVDLTHCLLRLMELEYYV